jgi:hypothetical protein
LLPYGGLAGELMFCKEHCCFRNKFHFRNRSIVLTRHGWAKRICADHAAGREMMVRPVPAASLKLL